jgi:hypothetical protein
MMMDVTESDDKPNCSVKLPCNDMWRSRNDDRILGQSDMFSRVSRLLADQEILFFLLIESSLLVSNNYRLSLRFFLLQQRDSSNGFVSQQTITVITTLASCCSCPRGCGPFFACKYVVSCPLNRTSHFTERPIYHTFQAIVTSTTINRDAYRDAYRDCFCCSLFAIFCDPTDFASLTSTSTESFPSSARCPRLASSATTKGT